MITLRLQIFLSSYRNNYGSFIGEGLERTAHNLHQVCFDYVCLHVCFMLLFPS